MVPPLTLLSAQPDILAAVWSIWRESQLALGPVQRTSTEAIAAAVSRLNACTYCVDAHSGRLHALSAHDVVSGILDDDGGKISQRPTRDIVQ